MKNDLQVLKAELGNLVSETSRAAHLNSNLSIRVKDLERKTKEGAQWAGIGTFPSQVGTNPSHSISNKRKRNDEDDEDIVGLEAFSNCAGDIHVSYYDLTGQHVRLFNRTNIPISLWLETDSSSGLERSFLYFRRDCLHKGCQCTLCLERHEQPYPWSTEWSTDENQLDHWWRDVHKTPRPRRNSQYIFFPSHQFSPMVFLLFLPSANCLSFHHESH